MIKGGASLPDLLTNSRCRNARNIQRRHWAGETSANEYKENRDGLFVLGGLEDDHREELGRGKREEKKTGGEAKDRMRTVWGHLSSSPESEQGRQRGRAPF